MPRKVRVRKWCSTAALAVEQEEDLMSGWRGAFATAPERKAAWLAARDRLMATCNPATRPAAWWDYEAPVALDPHRGQDEQLYVMGLLSDSERATFEAWCRRTGRDLGNLPPAGFRAPDARRLLTPQTQSSQPGRS